MKFVDNIVLSAESESDLWDRLRILWKVDAMILTWRWKKSKQALVIVDNTQVNWMKNWECKVDKDEETSNS